MSYAAKASLDASVYLGNPPETRSEDNESYTAGLIIRSFAR
jgi:hypothetical protein